MRSIHRCLAAFLLPFIFGAAVPDAELDRIHRLAATDPAACLAEIATTRSTPALAPQSELRLWLSEGLAHRKLQNFDEAIEAYGRAQAQAEQLDAAEDRAHAILGRGGVAFSRGDLSAARRDFELVLEVAAESRLEAVASRAWVNLGLVSQRKGRLRDALDAYTRAMGLGSDELKPIQLARRLNNIAMLHNDLGEHRVALDYLERAAEHYRESGRGTTHHKILMNSARAHRGLGDLDVALEELRRAHELQRTAGDRKAVASSLAAMAQVYVDRGEATRAIELYDQAIAIQRELGLSVDLVAARVNRSVALAEAGRAREAISSAAEGLEQGRLLDLDRERKTAAYALARSLEVSGDSSGALQQLRDAAERERAMRRGVDLPALRRLESSLASALEPASPASGLWVAASALILLLAALPAAWAYRRRQRRELRRICSHCKCIRDSRGDWQRLEAHMEREEGIEFSHGICPECVERYYHRAEADPLETG